MRVRTCQRRWITVTKARCCDGAERLGCEEMSAKGSALNQNDCEYKYVQRSTPCMVWSVPPQKRLSLSELKIAQRSFQVEHRESAPIHRKIAAKAVVVPAGVGKRQNVAPVDSLSLCHLHKYAWYWQGRGTSRNALEHMESRPSFSLISRMFQVVLPRGMNPTPLITPESVGSRTEDFRKCCLQ
ncbi:hypothetical protein Y032_0201g1750 [Ancylostoma ceylanicum]|uniref:Uncharacterized protein n=1 Tax=Ancylostoma ceylanicum TaxID=53326 RepID=A0A016SMK9_9BILA|nr:hypothetical protein Y032_0201g1750 [Ancylostoma ceylanicum]